MHAAHIRFSVLQLSRKQYMLHRRSKLISGFEILTSKDRRRLVDLELGGFATWREDMINPISVNA
jgi:hypothetical protein